MAEQHTSSDAAVTANGAAPDEAAVGIAVPAAVAPAPIPAAGRVESVPSEQLWRAAILAARQAAIAAAELRRALEQGSPTPIVGTEGGTGASLVS